MEGLIWETVVLLHRRPFSLTLHRINKWVGHLNKCPVCYEPHLKITVMIVLNSSKTLLSRERTTRRFYSFGALNLLRIVSMMWIGTNSFTLGQVELGYLDLLYPHKLHHVIKSELPADPYERIRSMTKRAKVTVEGLDQDRILTVFRASQVGHIEFGFPGQTNRAGGENIFIFVATFSSFKRESPKSDSKFHLNLSRFISCWKNWSI